MFGFGKKSGNSDEALHDQKALSDIIVQSIDDGVIMIDQDKTIRLFNNGAANITGWKQKDAVGLSYKSVIKLVDAKNEPYQDTQNPFEKIFNKKTAIRDNNANLMNASNSTIAISLSVSPLYSPNGQVNGAVGVFRDVTREREEEKRRSDFISTASHEMRTPIAAIEGYLSLAMNEQVSKIDTKARGYLEKAHISTENLGRLFQDLLTSTKVEDGRLQNHPIVIEMGELMQQIVEDGRFTAEKKGLVVEFIIGGNDNPNLVGQAGQKIVKPLYYVYADPERIREAIMNLFDNAIKYTETGKISLGLTGDNNIVQTRVQDTGPGIPAEDIPHLFQKFYRVDNSTTRVIGGTGLGLFICKKIVEMYNGRIWVDSKLGSGTSFYINLPRITPQKAEELKNQEAAQNLQPGITRTSTV
jgi:two-component system, OmpR family, sensor histidine kinase VicK